MPNNTFTIYCKDPDLKARRQDVARWAGFVGGPGVRDQEAGNFSAFANELLQMTPEQARLVGAVLRGEEARVQEVYEGNVEE